jgi:hypothetical protein
MDQTTFRMQMGQTAGRARYPLTSTATDPTNSTWRATVPGYTFKPFYGIDCTGPITNAANMFFITGVQTLNDPDLSTWDTSTFTNTQSMFANNRLLNININSCNI